MGNGIPGNPSGTLDSGQCCRTSVDWRSCMCQMGAKVEQCWSLWCTSSLQDDDPKRGGSFSLSNTISSVDLTTWRPDVRCHNQGGRSMGSNDTAAVVTARRGLARASQVWQDGRHDRTFNVLAPHLSATEGSESICQMGKLHEMPVKTLEGGEGSTRESFGEGGNGQKDGRTEAQGFSICSKTASATSPSSHSRTDERSADKRSTEQDRVRTWTCITNSHGSSEQQQQRSPREGAQGTGTASRVPSTHVGAAITDAAVSSTTGVCSDGSHSTARGTHNK